MAKDEPAEKMKRKAYETELEKLELSKRSHVNEKSYPHNMQYGRGP